MPESFDRYIAAVCGQVRWKRARAGLAGELRTHLLDQKDACLAEGMEEAAAEAESLRQMGDPVAVGTQLDRIHRPKPQWDLMLLVGLLLSAGLYLQWGIMGELAGNTSDAARAVPAVLIGVVLMLAVYWLDYTALGLHPFLACGMGLGVYVVSLWKGPVISGGRFMIPCYLSLLCPVLLALLLYGLRGRGWRGLILAVAAIWGCTALILCAPSFAGAGLSLLIGTGLLLLSIRKGWMGVPKGRGAAAAAACAAVPALLGLFTVSGFFEDRLAAALHPERDPMGKGYLAMKVRELLENAGWIGTGTQVEGAELLPAGHTDFFLSWTVYRLGWWAGLALVGLLALFLALACRRAARQKGMLGCLLSAAAVLTLGGEAILYLLSNLGFLFFGALALPFLSWGGWYMVVNLCLAGLLLSVFREERLPEGAVCGRRAPRRRCTVQRREGALLVTIPWGSDAK